MSDGGAGPKAGREAGSDDPARAFARGGRLPAARRVAVLGARFGVGRSATAARTPFVVLVVTLLAGGLISLLLLNAAVNRDSFTLDKLQDETTSYTDQQQQLQQEVDGYSAPGSLEQRARRLGMVPGGDPVFLAPNGRVQGSPSPATAPPPPPPSPSTAPPTPPVTAPATVPPSTAPVTTAPALATAPASPSSTPTSGR